MILPLVVDFENLGKDVSVECLIRTVAGSRHNVKTLRLLLARTAGRRGAAAAAEAAPVSPMIRRGRADLDEGGQVFLGGGRRRGEPDDSDRGSPGRALGRQRRLKRVLVSQHSFRLQLRLAGGLHRGGCQNRCMWRDQGSQPHSLTLFSRTTFNNHDSGHVTCSIFKKRLASWRTKNFQFSSRLRWRVEPLF